MTMEELMAVGFEQLRVRLEQYIAQQIRATTTALRGGQPVMQEETIQGNQEEVPEPEVQPGRERRNRRAVEVSEFLKLKPPTFCGTNPKEEPQHFLQDLG